MPRSKHRIEKIEKPNQACRDRAMFYGKHDPEHVRLARAAMTVNSALENWPAQLRFEATADPRNDITASEATRLAGGLARLVMNAVMNGDGAELRRLADAVEFAVQREPADPVGLAIDTDPDSTTQDIQSRLAQGKFHVPNRRTVIRRRRELGLPTAPRGRPKKT